MFKYKIVICLLIRILFSCTADEAAEPNILGGGGGKETNIDGDPCDYVPTVPEWHDITGEFFDAVKGLFFMHSVLSNLLISTLKCVYIDLSLGELVHHKIFGLFEAMSAIEMMDPKMDAGMCCNKNTTIISVIIERKMKIKVDK